MRIWLLLVSLVVSLVVGACTPMGKFPYVKMVDQRTFGATPEAPLQVIPLPDRALAVIRFDGQPADYSPDVTELVAAATGRKADVEFNVVTPVAIGQVPGPQAEADAATVARALAEQQILTERIHLGVVEEAGKPAREVRIYVR